MSAATGRATKSGLVLNFDKDGFYVGTPAASAASLDDEHSYESDEESVALADVEAAAAVAEGVPCCGRATRDTFMLAAMIAMVASFALAELIGGFASNSLALLADASHMISDMLSLSVGLAAMQLATRSETRRHSYGWQRAEVVGALSNGVFLVSICVFNVINAVVRVIVPERVEHPWVVLGVGVGGLVVNVVGLLMFCSHRSLHAHHGHDAHEGHNVNLHGVFLHILGDALGSLIVIATAVVYLVWPLSAAEAAASRLHWQLYVDPVSTLLFSAFMLKSAVPLLRSTVRVLMQATPSGIDKQALRSALEAVDGVVSVHELHVWQMAPGYAVGTVHVQCANASTYRAACRAIKHVFHTHHVHRTTVQAEFCAHAVRSADGRNSCCHTPRHSASCCTPLQSSSGSDEDDEQHRQHQESQQP